MQKIKSYEEAYEVASEIIGGLEIGESVALNAISLSKVEYGTVVVNNAEYNFERGAGSNVELKMVASELADLVFFPERKRINDALEEK